MVFLNVIQLILGLLLKENKKIENFNLVLKFQAGENYDFVILLMISNQQAFEQTPLKFQKVPELDGDDELMRACISVNSDEEVQRWETKLKQIKSIDCQYLLLPRTHKYTTASSEGTLGTLALDFLNYQYILDQQIRNRMSITKPFQEKEIWYLLYVIASATEHCRKLNKKVGDIRSSNIRISDEGTIKLICYCSQPYEKTNYQKALHKQEIALLSPSEITYLSPEECQEIKDGVPQTTHNQFVSESFSVGLTLLEIATLQLSADLYSKQGNFLLCNKLKGKIQKLLQLEGKAKYSLALKLAIAGLCEIEPKQRSTCQEIFQWLSPYSQQILQMEQIHVELPPFLPTSKYQDLINATIPAAPPCEEPQPQKELTPPIDPTSSYDAIVQYKQTYNPEKNIYQIVPYLVEIKKEAVYIQSKIEEYYGAAPFQKHEDIEKELMAKVDQLYQQGKWK